MSRESLIESLRSCVDTSQDCHGCVYDYKGCQSKLMLDAADMLERDGRQISQMEVRLMVKEEGKTAKPEPELFCYSFRDSGVRILADQE